MQAVQGTALIEYDQTTIICLHSSASSAQQWRNLSQEWSEFNVLAPNLVGYGGQFWRTGDVHTMADEVHAIGEVMSSCPGPVHLIGHSFGGAVATLVALENPQQVRSLTLFEPVLFPLLYATAEGSGQEIWVLQTDVRRHVQLGNNRAAAERFVDYWSGEGAFQNLSEHARQYVIAMTPKVAAEFAALISNPISEADLRSLRVPTLLLYGEDSPDSTRDITRLLARILPCRELLEFDGLGHMGPMEDPDRVNATIAEFVGRHSVPDSCFSTERPAELKINTSGGVT